jgi:hypothetical protein
MLRKRLEDFADHAIYKTLIIIISSNKLGTFVMLRKRLEAYKHNSKRMCKDSLPLKVYR